MTGIYCFDTSVMASTDFYFEVLPDWKSPLIGKRVYSLILLPPTPPPEMSVINSSSLAVIIRTIAFEVSGKYENVWLAFLLRHCGSCYIWENPLTAGMAWQSLNQYVIIVHFLQHQYLSQCIFVAIPNPSHQFFGGHFLLLWQLTPGHCLCLLVGYIIHKFLTSIASSLHWVYKYLIPRLLKRDYLKMIYSTRESVT